MGRPSRASNSVSETFLISPLLIIASIFDDCYNCTRKNCNGVVPVKEKCYQILEEEFRWYREKPLTYFRKDAQKGGPIDV